MKSRQISKPTKTVSLIGGHRSDGSPVLEEVRVRQISPDRFIVDKSPGLCLGVAAGDEIEISGDGTYAVLVRGGNLAIQVFADAVEHLDQIESLLTPSIQQLGGWLDGRTFAKSVGELVYTAPQSIGFEAMEAALDAATKAVPGTQWFYGNVYDPTDGVTPLNWWMH